MNSSEIIKKYIGYMDILKEINKNGVTNLSLIDVMRMNDIVNVESVNDGFVVGNCITNNREFSFHVSPNYIYLDYSKHEFVDYVTTCIYESLSLEFIEGKVSVEYRQGGFEIFEKTSKENKLGPQILIVKEFPVSSEFDFITGISELYNVTCQSNSLPAVSLKKFL